MADQNPRLRLDPATTPPRDERLVQLIEGALVDRVPLYWCAVPLRYIRPLSPEFKPVTVQYWRDVVSQLKESIRRRDYPYLLVYQIGDFFVMSDDYPAYYAYMEANSEYAPCYTLGRPTGDHVSAVRPVEQDERRRVLGG